MDSKNKPVSSSHTCRSCDGELLGDYCHQCGERRMNEGQRKLSLLFGQLVDSLFSVDGKLNRTFYSVLFRPGLLSYDHWRGKRNPYMRPIALFFLVNVIYFVIVPITDFSLSFNDQKIQPYREIVVAEIENKVATGQFDLAQLEEKYNSIKNVVSKSILFLSIPFLVPFVWLVNRNKKYYLIDHAVYSIHLYTFILIWPLFFVLIRILLRKLELLSLLPNSFMPLTSLVILYIYAFIGQRIMYQNNLVISGLKAVFILCGIILSHFIYRFVQFWIVWWQIS